LKLILTVGKLLPPTKIERATVRYYLQTSLSLADVENMLNLSKYEQEKKEQRRVNQSEPYLSLTARTLFYRTEELLPSKARKHKPNTRAKSRVKVQSTNRRMEDEVSHTQEEKE
jgi:hypothetical protein